MPRQAREISPTGYYHVMMRGNNREYIFSKDKQKVSYINELKAELDEGLIEIAAWCLMDNHVHLVLKGELTDISSTIKRVNIKYAMHFNHFEDRIGHVFQDRYRSEVIKSDSHLLGVIRYVHNNPVKAGLVTRPGEYAWSSYRSYLQPQSMLSPAQRSLVMGYFSGDPGAFAEFHRRPDDAEHLETKEDLERERLQRGAQIIAGFCVAKGKHDVTDVCGDAVCLIELVGQLVDKGRLSHAHIARLLGLSRSRIHRINLQRQSEAEGTVPNASALGMGV